MSAALHEDAVCLRHWDYSETSQVVSLLTRAHGLVRALAKGSKRPKTPFSGGLETLTRGTAGLILKPDADLALLTDWDLHAAYPGLRGRLASYHVACYLGEVTQLALRDRDPHPALFDALVGSLETLGSSQPPRDDAEPARTLGAFQWTLLVETGFQPSLDAPHEVADGILLFLPDQGEFVAQSSARDREIWKVRAATLQSLRAVASGEAAGLDRASARAASRLLAWYLRVVLGREPNTFDLLFPQSGGGAGRTRRSPEA